MYKRRKSFEATEQEKTRRQENLEKMDKQIPSNAKKKWVRYEEGSELYSMGLHSFQKLAKDAKAVYHVGRIVLVNTEKPDEYMELMCADDPSDI